jgi:hypothetical protein
MIKSKALSTNENNFIHYNLLNKETYLFDLKYYAYDK